MKPEWRNIPDPINVAAAWFGGWAIPAMLGDICETPLSSVSKPILASQEIPQYPNVGGFPPQGHDAKVRSCGIKWTPARWLLRWGSA